MRFVIFVYPFAFSSFINTLTDQFSLVMYVPSNLTLYNASVVTSSFVSVSSVVSPTVDSISDFSVSLIDVSALLDSSVFSIVGVVSSDFIVVLVSSDFKLLFASSVDFE